MVEIMGGRTAAPGREHESIRRSVQVKELLLDVARLPVSML